MCGILGSINLTFDDSVLDTIQHRGPDDFGIENFLINQHVIQLGQRRLSIVDLSPAGHQPMLSDCAEYCIIFNGEIYNHHELKERLPKGIEFKGHSDTETILYYLREFGIEAIKDLNGIFAFCFLDIKNEFLYLVRDRFGVKPLYYHFNGFELLFSSEIRPLKSLLSPDLDFAALLNSLRFRYYPAPLTPYQGISKIEPGQVLAFQLKKDAVTVSQQSFLQPTKSIGNLKSDKAEILYAYGDLFEKAVERQLMADVDVGILLSGGIDSALIAAIAKGKSKHRVKVFTVGFEGQFENIDELDYAAETAGILGLDHYFTRLSFEDFLGSMKKAVDIVEEPLGTTSIVPMLFLSKLAASHVKVVLSGQGVDEPLGGYAKYRGLPLLQMLRKLRPGGYFVKKFESLYRKKESLRRFISAYLAEDEIEAFIEYNSIESSSAICSLLNKSNNDWGSRALKLKQDQFYKLLKARNPEIYNIRSLFLYHDLRSSLADDLLMYTDKITMHFGLECRVPVLDNELIGFAESLKSSYKYNTWSGKLLHKAFAREYLPPSIINRKKIGFQSPTRNWFKVHKDEIFSIFSSSSTFSGVFNLSRIRNLQEMHEGGVNLEKQIFLLLGILYLLESNENSKMRTLSEIALA